VVRSRLSAHLLFALYTFSSLSNLPASAGVKQIQMLVLCNFACTPPPGCGISLSACPRGAANHLRGMHSCATDGGQPLRVSRAPALSNCARLPHAADGDGRRWTGACGLTVNDITLFRIHTPHPTAMRHTTFPAPHHPHPPGAPTRLHGGWRRVRRQPFRHGGLFTATYCV